MPSETLLEPSPRILAEQQEAEYSADNFCAAYGDVVGLIRHGLAVAESQLGFSDSQLRAADAIIYSPQLRSHIESTIATGNYPEILADSQKRALVIDMACDGIFGRLVELQLRRDRAGASRENKERLIQMNHNFTELADSEFGKNMGFGRRHLRAIIGATYGLPQESEEVAALERGLAVEVGTKNCLAELGKEHGVEVRWASAAEDLRNVDIVCLQGAKRLDIQVKSVDSVGRTAGDLQQASYSRPEEYGLHEYRVRELSPAADTAVGENFEVRAARYGQKIDELLTELDQLQ